MYLIIRNLSYVSVVLAMQLFERMKIIVFSNFILLKFYMKIMKKCFNAHIPSCLNFIIILVVKIIWQNATVKNHNYYMYDDFAYNINELMQNHMIQTDQYVNLQSAFIPKNRIAVTRKCNRLQELSVRGTRRLLPSNLFSTYVFNGSKSGETRNISTNDLFHKILNVSMLVTYMYIFLEIIQCDLN